MSEKDLREFISRAAPTVARLFDKFHEISPHVLLDHGGGEIAVVDLNIPKAIAAHFLRFILSKGEVVRYCFIDEAWMLAVPRKDVSEEDETKFMNEGIQNHPDRVEVIIYSAEDHEVQITARQYIIRGTGAPTLGELVIDAPMTSAHGRMVGLMPRKGGTQ